MPRIAVSGCLVSGQVWDAQIARAAGENFSPAKVAPGRASLLR